MIHLGPVGFGRKRALNIQADLPRFIHELRKRTRFTQVIFAAKHVVRYTIINRLENWLSKTPRWLGHSWMRFVRRWKHRVFWHRYGLKKRELFKLIRR